MDEFILMTLLVVIANGVFDAVVVAWLAGKRSKAALVSWMQSPEAVPYMDMIADRAMLRINPLIRQVTERIDSIEIPEIPDIPAVNLQPIYDAISAQGASLKADVVESCTQAFNGMQSGAVRALQGQLKPYDEMLDNVGNEIMGHLAANASPLDLAKAEILGTKISDKYARDHPAAAMILKTGKIQLLQMLEAGQIPGLAGEAINKGATVTKPLGPLG
jgi:hypothetical protein